MSRKEQEVGIATTKYMRTASILILSGLVFFFNQVFFNNGKVVLMDLIQIKSSEKRLAKKSYTVTSILHEIKS